MPGTPGLVEVLASPAATARVYLAGTLALAEEIDSRVEQSRLHAGYTQAQALAREPIPALVHTQRAVALAEAAGCAMKLSGETLEKLR